MADKQFNQTVPHSPNEDMYVHVIDKNDGVDKFIDQSDYNTYIESTLTPPDDFVDYPRVPYYTAVSTDSVVPFQTPSTEAYGGISISELKRVMVDATYPVGTIYENYSDSRNPVSYFGVGTWVAWGSGKCVLGVGEGSDINAVNLVVSQGQTGGEYLHTLTEAEIAKHDHIANVSPDPHSHNVSLYYPTDTSIEKDKVSSGRSGTHDTTSVQSTSLSVTVLEQEIGDQAHNNIQPYVSAYRWRRIS